MIKTMYLRFRPDVRFESNPYNGHSRMTLCSLDTGEVIKINRALVPATAIVLDGEITLLASDKEFYLKPGEAILLEPNESHSLKAIEKSAVIVTCLANLPKEKGN